VTTEEQPHSPSFFYGYIVVAACFIIWLVAWGTFTPSFSLFLKPLTAEFGWSRSEASLAYSLAFTVMAMLGLVMGWLTDRFGPRLVVTVCGSFLGLSYLLLSQVHTLREFQLFYGLVGGIGASTISIPVMVTVSRWFVAKRGLMIGIVQAGMGLGGLFFPPLIGRLILAYGWRRTYVVLGITALAGICGAGSLLVKEPARKGAFPDGAASGSRCAQEAHHAGHAAQAHFFRSPLFWIMVGLFCTFGFCRSAFLSHIVAHVQDLGFTLTQGADIIAVIIGTSILGRVGMGRLSDAVGGRMAMAASFSLTTLALVLGLAAGSLPGLYAFALVYGFGWGNQAVLRFSLTARLFGLTTLGFVSGILGIAESGAAVFGTYYAGYLYDVTGSYTLLFKTGIAVSLAGVAFAAMIKPPAASSRASRTTATRES
jgi:MFS family permease